MTVPWPMPPVQLTSVGFLPEPREQHSVTTDSPNCFRAYPGPSGPVKTSFIKWSLTIMLGTDLSSFLPSPCLLIHHTEFCYRTQDRKAQPERKFKDVNMFLFLIFFLFALKTITSLFLSFSPLMNYNCRRPWNSLQSPDSQTSFI